MGWISYRANFYDRYGNVNRKTECDSLIATDRLSILKSSMVGSIYYAAVKDNETGNVFACVVLTSVTNKSYVNFAYEAMDETYGPFAIDCPISILKLLSPTDDKYALSWRKRCYKRYEMKKQLSILSLGSVIRVGDTKYIKSKWGKYTRWINWTKMSYIMPKQALDIGYEIIYSRKFKEELK